MRSAEKKAPLWAMIILIGLVVSSVGYTFVASSLIQEKIGSKLERSNREIADKLSNNNASIQAALLRIQTDLAVAQSRQSDIKILIEKHMDNRRNGVYDK